MQDTCGIHVSLEVIKIHAGYMRDTCGIHVGYMWDKDYVSMLNAIRKKHKGLMKMSKMTAMTGMGSSSAKQTKKEKIIWVDKAKKEVKDAGDFKEAVELLPEVFGEGRYGTSGVPYRRAIP